MSTLLFLHLFLLGAWLGCVMVEGVLELIARRSAAAAEVVAETHFWIDMTVEIPCFTGVLATGLGMLDTSRLAGPLAWKVGLGAFAVLVNAGCVVPVVLRRAAARRGDAAGVARHSRGIYAAFALGVPAGLGALGLGVYLLGLY